MNDKILQAFNDLFLKFGTEQQRIYFMAAMFLDKNELSKVQKALNLPSEICQSIDSLVPSVHKKYEIDEMDKMAANSKWGSFLSSYLSSQRNSAIRFVDQLKLVEILQNRTAPKTLEEITQSIISNPAKTLFNSLSNLMTQAFIVSDQQNKAQQEAIDFVSKNNDGINHYIGRVLYQEDLYKKRKTLYDSFGELLRNLASHLQQCDKALNTCFNEVGFTEESVKKYALILKERDAVVSMIAKAEWEKESLEDRYNQIMVYNGTVFSRNEACDLGKMDKNIVPELSDLEKIQFSSLDIEKNTAWLSTPGKILNYIDQKVYPLLIDADRLLNKKITSDNPNTDSNVNELVKTLHIISYVLNERINPEIQKYQKGVQSYVSIEQKLKLDFKAYDVILKELTIINEWIENITPLLAGNVLVNGTALAHILQPQNRIAVQYNTTSWLIEMPSFKADVETFYNEEKLPDIIGKDSLPISTIGVIDIGTKVVTSQDSNALYASDIQSVVQNPNKTASSLSELAASFVEVEKPQNEEIVPNFDFLGTKEQSGFSGAGFDMNDPFGSLSLNNNATSPKTPSMDQPLKSQNENDGMSAEQMMAMMFGGMAPMTQTPPVVETKTEPIAAKKEAETIKTPVEPVVENVGTKIEQPAPKPISKPKKITKAEIAEGVKALRETESKDFTDKLIEIENNHPGFRAKFNAAMDAIIKSLQK